MTTPVRVAGFVLGLLVVFLAARGVGAFAGPDPAPPASMAHDDLAGDRAVDGHEEAGSEGDHGGHDAGAEAVPHTPGGLQVSEQGYTFRVVSAPRRGADRRLELVIEDAHGERVTDFDDVHDQPLHLVKVRRDGAGYEHVHPTLGADGVWTARLTLAPGANRLFADFTPTDGPALVLGTDVQVGGSYRPSPPPAVSRSAGLDGYEVALEGDLVAGESSPVTATVTRGGEPVDDLQPYLGAYGHLVALREGDLAYLHVHPEEGDAGPTIPFLAEVPSPGRYRLFLDFRHDGVVRTVGFTLRAEETAHVD